MDRKSGIAIGVVLALFALIAYAYGSTFSAIYVGEGTPSLSQSAGTFEADGAARFDSTVDFNGAIDVSAGTVTLGSQNIDGTYFDVTGASGNVTSSGIITGDSVSIVKSLYAGSTVSITASTGVYQSLGYAQASGFGIYNPVYELFTGDTCTGLVTQTTGTGWSFALGSKNGRDGALAACTATTDTTANDAMTISFGNTIALGTGGYNFIGVWLRNAETYDGNEYDLTIVNKAGTALTGVTAVDVRAGDTADWVYQEIYIGGATSAIRNTAHGIKITHVGTNGIVIDIVGAMAYRVSNGKGACNGNVITAALGTGTLDKGDLVVWEELLVNKSGLMTRVREAGDTSNTIAGVVCDTDSTGATSGQVLIQTEGVVVLTTAGAVADNALVNSKSATTIDDDGASVTGDRVGYAIEAAGTGSSAAGTMDIYVRMK